MNDATANLSAEPGGRWTPGRWFFVIAFVIVLHVALIFIFGEKHAVIPRTIEKVPTITLADADDELLALGDPTLFALPQQRDLATVAFLKLPPVNQPTNRYTEPARPLPFSANGLGAAFGRFMPTNVPVAREPLDLRPVPELTVPTLPEESGPGQNSTMQIAGDLAHRQLPAQISLTKWPFPDVLAPSKVQVLVDAAGTVVSTVLLESCSYKEADDQALNIARTLRFTPSPGLTLGKIIFNWQTVPPMTTTNGHE